VIHQNFRDFVDLVVPELQQRRAFGTVPDLTNLILKSLARLGNELWVRPAFALFLAAAGAVPLVQNAIGAEGNALSLVRIGYQKYGSLNVVKAQGTFDQELAQRGIKVQWTQFPAGPQLLEGVNVGSIDIGHSGEAPPIFAQAAGTPFVYIGSQPPYPVGEAIIVPKNSPIKSVADLKGKRIALNKGSNVHYLLVQALEKAGLKYHEIQLAFLPPADARAAFDGGKIDAWAIWDPFLTVAQAATEARVLTDGEGLVANREFFFATRKFAETHPEIIQELKLAIDRAATWTKEKPAEVAAYLSRDIGVDPQLLEVITRRQPLGFQPIDAAVLADQQRIADTFFHLGLIPKQIDVNEAVAKNTVTKTN
jgi:sulfonate transport system substrate-binding protein